MIHFPSPKKPSFKNKEMIATAFLGFLAAIVAAATTNKVSEDMIKSNASISNNTIKEERFFKAAELIGDESSNVRSAGAVTMGQVMNDSPDKEWDIIEVLANLISTNSENPRNKDRKNVSPDVRTAVNIIVARTAKISSEKDEKYEQHKKDTNPKPLNLREINIRDAFLVDTEWNYADLSISNFSRSDLREVTFLEADLRKSNFSKAKLNRANLKGANLSDANLKGADLSDADLEGTHLEGATFTDEQIQKSCNWHLAKYDRQALQRLKPNHKRLRETRSECPNPD
jgi:uncharacterized protein YjbI with pentapeptide repeats